MTGISTSIVVQKIKLQSQHTDTYSCLGYSTSNPATCTLVKPASRSCLLASAWHNSHLRSKAANGRQLFLSVTLPNEKRNSRDQPKLPVTQHFSNTYIKIIYISHIYHIPIKSQLDYKGGSLALAAGWDTISRIRVPGFHTKLQLLTTTSHQCRCWVVTQMTGILYTLEPPGLRSWL